MYDKSSEYIGEAARLIENGQISEARTNVSMAEAYLPITDSEKNRVVSRYVSLVSAMDSDNTEFSNTVVKATSDIGIDLSECLNSEDFPSEDITRRINELWSEIEYFGEVSRVSEDSAWGQMVKDIIED